MTFLKSTALSYEEVRTQLEDFIKSLPENERWADFFASSAGQTLIELMSGLGTYAAFHSMSARGEAYVDTAQLRTSLLQIANMYGYAVNRSSAPKLLLRFPPLTADVSLTGDDVGNPNSVGFYKDKKIVPLRTSTIRTSLSPQWVEAYLGTWKYKDIQVLETKDFYRAKVDDLTIDNDLERLRLSVLGTVDEVLSLVRYAEEMAPQAQFQSSGAYTVAQSGNILTIGGGLSFFTSRHLGAKLIFDGALTATLLTISPDGKSATTEVSQEHTAGVFVLQLVPEPKKVLVRTSPDGVFLIFGDNVFGRKVGIGDQVRFSYLSSQGRLPIGVTGQEFLAEASWTVKDTSGNSVSPDMIEVVTPGYNEDTKDKIRSLLPGYFAARRRMLTREDHIAVLMSYLDVVSASVAKKNTEDEHCECCVILMSYLFGDEHLLFPPSHSDVPPYSAFRPSSEEEKLLAYLGDYKPVGEVVELVNPTKIHLRLKMTIVVEEGTDTLSLKNKKIVPLLNSMLYQLNGTFRPGEFIARLSGISGILRVYLEQPTSDLSMDTFHYLGIDGVRRPTSGKRPKFTVNLTPTGLTAPITKSQGSGYSVVTAAALVEAPTSGVTATLDLEVVGGKIIGAQLSNVPSGYTKEPQVTITDPSGKGAVIVLRLSPTSVSTVDVVYGGAGFTSSPQLSVAGDGTGVVLEPLLTAGAISSVTVWDGGNGFTKTPKVSWIGGGCQDNEKAYVDQAVSDNFVDSLDITFTNDKSFWVAIDPGNPSTGYFPTPPTVTSITAPTRTIRNVTGTDAATDDYLEINGQNLGGTERVMFGKVPGVIYSVTAAQVKVVVPSAAQTGYLSVFGSGVVVRTPVMTKV